MRSKLLSIAFITCAAGCTNSASDSESPQDKGNNSGVWSLSTSTSGIDGEVLTSSREFNFGGQVTFVATATCRKNSSKFDLVIDSFVGERQNPSEKSAFAEDSIATHFPAGRAKLPSRSAESLYAYFTLDGNYSNRIVSTNFSPLTDQTVKKDPTYNEEISIDNLYANDVNWARAFKMNLPMTIEVNNGAGTFELPLEPSSEVLRVLEACGSEGPMLLPTYQKRVEAQISKSRLEYTKLIKEQCGQYGNAFGELGKDWADKFNSSGLNLDCSIIAPEEFATFNSKIDKIYEQIQSRLSEIQASNSNVNLDCSRDAIVSQVGKKGLFKTFNYCEGLEQQPPKQIEPESSVSELIPRN